MTEARARLEFEAARLMKGGSVEAAVAAHRALLAAHPESAEGWYNLALLERRARRPVASLAALDEALSRGIGGAEEVWLQRALVLSDNIRDPAGARTALGQALKLAPRYLPALLNLGNLEEDCGDRVAAETCYRTALAVMPDHPLALARLAGVAGISGPGDPILDALRRVLSQVQGISLAEADLGFALGAALDRLGEYDAAFDAYLAANQASRIFAASHGKRYDRAAQQHWVDRVLSAFTPPCANDDGDVPLFVCGMVRSGSTLVERMLSRHDALEAGGELDAIPAIAARITSYPEAIETLTDDDRHALAEHYRSETRRRGRDGRMLIDKRPDNIFHLPLIRAIFPNARVVRTVRAPMDNALSVFFLHADATLGWATDLNDIAHYLTQERCLAERARARFGSTFHELSYERLVEDPRAEMSALLAFCGLDWDEQVLDPVGGGGVVKTASVWQVREPIHRRSSGRWRNYAHRLGDLAAILESVV